MRTILMCLLLVGCATTAPQDTTSTKPNVPQKASPPQETPSVDNPPEPEAKHKYAVGDCLMVVDLPQGAETSPYRVRVEEVTKDTYWYRWLLEDGEWALDQSCLRDGTKPCSPHSALEKISKKVDDCPK